MRAHLYLLPPGSDRLGREHAEPWDERAGWYDHAATLDVEPRPDVADTLQAAYARTQNGRGDWTAGDAVAWASGPGLRSSYVGDVVVLEGAGSRAVYEVAFADFRRIDVPADQVPPPRTVPPTPDEHQASGRDGTR